MDINIFFKIIAYLSDDISNIDFHQEENLKYFHIKSDLNGEAYPECLTSRNHPSTQPGHDCYWIASADGANIQWNEYPKFHDYIPWLEYIIEHFLQPWGYTLNGSVTFACENLIHHGVIDVVNNIVTATYDPDLTDYYKYSYEYNRDDSSEEEEEPEPEEEEPEINCKELIKIIKKQQIYFCRQCDKILRALPVKYKNFPSPNMVSCNTCNKIAVLLLKDRMQLKENDHICKKGNMNVYDILNNL